METGSAGASFAALWDAWVGPIHPAVFVIVGSFLHHEIIWLIFNLPYLIIAQYGWCEQYRIVKVPRVSSHFVVVCCVCV